MNTPVKLKKGYCAVSGTCSNCGKPFERLSKIGDVKIPKSCVKCTGGK